MGIEYYTWHVLYDNHIDGLGLGTRVLHPKKEIYWYELHWATKKTPYLKALPAGDRECHLPPSLVPTASLPKEVLKSLNNFLDEHHCYEREVLIRGTYDYPDSLTCYDLPLLYYRGDLSLLSSPCVAVTGSATTDQATKKRARDIASGLVARGLTVVAGLAKGVETIAHQTVFACHGRTIGVLGENIGRSATARNKTLQEKISWRHLLLSYVPLYRTTRNNDQENKIFFVERNKIIAALAQASIIVDVGNMAAPPPLAKETAKLGKPLILCKQVFANEKLVWPHKYIQKANVHLAETAQDAITLARKL